MIKSWRFTQARVGASPKAPATAQCAAARRPSSWTSRNRKRRRRLRLSRTFSHRSAAKAERVHAGTVGRSFQSTLCCGHHSRRSSSPARLLVPSLPSKVKDDVVLLAQITRSFANLSTRTLRISHCRTDQLAIKQWLFGSARAGLSTSLARSNRSSLRTKTSRRPSHQLVSSRERWRRCAARTKRTHAARGPPHPLIPRV